MDFTAIDFETANRRSDSACQLGAAVVRGGAIVARHQWLIRPRPFYFDAGNIRIHGISPQHVADELEFDERWDEIWSVLSSDCLIAHNAAFDIRVLQGCLRTHEIVCPRFEFSCTRLIARRTWPEWPGYGLAAIANRLDITFRHHDALEDAVACAKVLLNAATEAKVNSLPDLEQRVTIRRGRCGPDGYRGVGSPYDPASRRSFFSPTRRHKAGLSRSDPTATRSSSFSVSTARAGTSYAGDIDPVEKTLDLEDLRTRGESLRPWTEKHVIFTGVLEHMQRYQAEQLAECLGATCQRAVSGKTNLVVVGQLDQRTLAAERTQSVKEEEARRRAEDGQAIEFLTEDDFLQIFAQQPSCQSL